MVVGYARVSTKEQNEARQVLMLNEKMVEKLYVDKASGKNADRPRLKEMLDFIRTGDVVVVESISRLARSTRDLLNIVQQFQDKGVQFVSQKEAIDTDTPQGRFMLTVFAAMAELERENILQRQAEGIAIAVAAGKYHGRPPMKIDEKLFRSVCLDWRNGKMTARAAMNKLGLSANTFYRRVKELGV